MRVSYNEALFSSVLFFTASTILLLYCRSRLYRYGLYQKLKKNNY